MTIATDEPVPPVMPMEEFFAHTGQGANGQPLAVGPLMSAAASGILMAGAGGSPGQPGQATADDGSDGELPGDSEWLRTERKRLQAYTAQRFAVLRHTHETFLAHRFKLEEDLTRRTQEVSQQLAQLAAGREDLRRREEALAEHERGVAAREKQLAEAQTRVAELQEAARRLETETAETRQQLERLTTEKEPLESAMREAQAALVALHEARAEGESAWQGEQAAMAERRRQAEDRYVALEKAEADIARRQRELDDWDGRLHQECEEHEQGLSSERRALVELRDKYLANAARLESDPELGHILDTWPKLPDYVKQTVRVLIASAK
jgi:chromosome segregation ATPase